MIVAIFGVVILIEQKILRHFGNYAVSAFFWTILLGAATYFAKMKAVSDINSIFPFDASALPMTLVAGTVIQLSIFLFWPLVTCAAVTAIYFFFKIRDSEFWSETHKNPLAVIFSAALIFFMTGMSAFYVNHFFSETKRLHILYRVAHAADFSSNFNCAGVDPQQYHVLFVGPEQRRISIAGIIPETFLYFGPRVADIVQEVTLPSKESLELQDCLPRIAETTDPLAERINELHFEIKPINN
ncbi:hypothetical protein JJN09_27420 [Pseudomonas sp. HS6]|nr:hypothetical protein JJN09_27420 [Pseudomonas sp. HS6]